MSLREKVEVCPSFWNVGKFLVQTERERKCSFDTLYLGRRDCYAPGPCGKNYSANISHFRDENLIIFSCPKPFESQLCGHLQAPEFPKMVWITLWRNWLPASSMVFLPNTVMGNIPGSLSPLILLLLNLQGTLCSSLTCVCCLSGCLTPGLPLALALPP